VLIVGRHADILEAVTEQLQQKGYSIMGTLDEEEARERFASESFDAVVFGGGVDTPERKSLASEMRLTRPEVAIVQPSSPETVMLSIEAALSARLS